MKGNPVCTGDAEIPHVVARIAAHVLTVTSDVMGLKPHTALLLYLWSL